MKLHEAEALLEYLRHRLLDHVEQFECHVGDEVIGDMYDSVYKVLQDLEMTLDMQCAIDLDERSHLGKN